MLPSAASSSAGAILSPLITVDKPGSLSPTTPPPASRSTSRSRSLSPPASPPPIGSVISPRGSRVFAAASRPSPVVPSPSLPASPSFSRPTSPRPKTDEPASPSRSTHDLSLSASNSAVDLSHIFERDVEFASSHHLSGAEAIDVAVPPILDEAAVALSGPEELTSSEVASIVRESEDLGSGWSSPVLPAPSQQHHHHHPYSTASRSPVRGQGQRSFSPDSLNSGRATSPGSAKSFSVGTPGSSPPTSGALHPFTQHLSDALLDSTTRPHKSRAVPALLVASGSGIPFPTTVSDTGSAPSPLPATPSIDTLHDRRRLSFMSLADVINEERLSELQGNPVGSQGPSRAVGGGLDLEDLMSSLQVAP